MYIYAHSHVHIVLSCCSLLIIQHSCCLYSPPFFVLIPKIVIHHAKVPWSKDSSGHITKYMAFLSAHKLPLITNYSLLTGHCSPLTRQHSSAQRMIFAQKASLASQTSYMHNYMAFSLPSQLHKTNHKTHSYSPTTSTMYAHWQSHKTSLFPT